MPQNTTAQNVVDAIRGNGYFPTDHRTLRDFYMDRTNSFVDFRALWSFYEAFVKGYNISPKTLHSWKSKGGKAFAAKMKQQLESKPGIVPDHHVAFFHKHQYIWDSSLGDGDDKADPGQIDNELLDVFKEFCTDREGFEEMLRQNMAESLDIPTRALAARGALEGRVKQVADEVFGKDQSATSALFSAIMSGDLPDCPSRDKLKTMRGYGFERVPHPNDAAKLFAIYTHLVKTCGLTSATLNKWMLEGYLKLGANIKAEINKTTEAHQKIPADLVAWFNEQEYIWDRTDSNKQVAALLRHPNVEVKFNSFLKPQDQEKINDEIKELVESFRALTPNEPSFDVMEEIERRAKKYGCYEVEMGVPKERGESSSAEGGEFDGKN